MEIGKRPAAIDLDCGKYCEKLLQFRQAIDNSQPYLIAHLHLNHLGRQTFTNPIGIFQIKLNVSATLFDEVKKQQACDVLEFLLARVRTQVQNLGH